MPCKSNCQLFYELEWANTRLIHFELSPLRLDISLNQLEQLKQRAPVLERVEKIRREIGKTKERIRQVKAVIGYGCFLCHDVGIVFV